MPLNSEGVILFIRFESFVIRNLSLKSEITIFRNPYFLNMKSLIYSTMVLLSSDFSFHV